MMLINGAAEAMVGCVACQCTHRIMQPTLLCLLWKAANAVLDPDTSHWGSICISRGAIDTWFSLCCHAQPCSVCL